MSSHICGRVLAIASAALLSACKTFSPDGGMGTVATIAGQGLNKDVVRVSSPADAAYAQTRVARLLKAPLSADAAVQIALLNNAELQAAYNRLGIAEAVAVQSSRPPLPIFRFDDVSTSLELDIERASYRSRLGRPARRSPAFASSRRSCAPPRRRCAWRRRRGRRISAPSPHAKS